MMTLKTDSLKTEQPVDPYIIQLFSLHLDPLLVLLGVLDDGHCVLIFACRLL